jgi:hypothetical protein
MVSRYFLQRERSQDRLLLTLPHKSWDSVPVSETVSIFVEFLTETSIMMRILQALMLLLLLASCTATVPAGPGVLVLPGEGKDLARFHRDEEDCRQFAGEPLLSSSAKPQSDEEIQRLYDMGFIQCMYHKGHRVPLPDGLTYGSLQDADGPAPEEMEMPRP